MLTPEVKYYIGKTKEEILTDLKAQVGPNLSFDNKMTLNMISLWFLTDNNGKIDNIEEAKSLDSVFADPIERAGKEANALESNSLFEGLAFFGKTVAYLGRLTAYEIGGAIGALFQ